MVTNNEHISYGNPSVKGPSFYLFTDSSPLVIFVAMWCNVGHNDNGIYKITLPVFYILGNIILFTN